MTYPPFLWSAREISFTLSFVQNLPIFLMMEKNCSRNFTVKLQVLSSWAMAFPPFWWSVKNIRCTATLPRLWQMLPWHIVCYLGTFCCPEVNLHWWRFQWQNNPTTTYLLIYRGPISKNKCRLWSRDTHFFKGVSRFLSIPVLTYYMKRINPQTPRKIKCFMPNGWN